MTENIQGQVIQLLFYVATGVFTIWRIEKVGQTSEKAVKTSEENKAAIDIGNVKTDELTAKTEVVHQQFNGQMEKYTAELAEKNKELITQAVAMARSERDSIIEQLKSEIAALHVGVLATAQVRDSIDVIKSQNLVSIDDRKKINERQEEMMAAIAKLTAAHDAKPGPDERLSEIRGDS